MKSESYTGNEEFDEDESKESAKKTDMHAQNTVGEEIFKIWKFMDEKTIPYWWVGDQRRVIMLYVGFFINHKMDDKGQMCVCVCGTCIDNSDDTSEMYSPARGEKKECLSRERKKIC